MADIIDLKAERAKRIVPIDSYFVRVDLFDFEDNIGGAILDHDLVDMSFEDEPECLRTISEHLFTLARHVRDMAWVQSQDDDDRQLSVVRVYTSSRVNAWTSDDISTPEQVEWLARRLEEAKSLASPAMIERENGDG